MATELQAYALAAEADDLRAKQHAQTAVELIEHDPLVALTHALLALEARVSELSYFVAQRG